MIYEYTDYRQYLRAALVERITKNPSYSLRAMASQIGVSPSTLSEALAGKRAISVSRASQVASKLGLSTEAAEYFCLLVQLENTAEAVVKESILKRMSMLNGHRPINNLCVDTFRAIADWYHIAILNLTNVEGFDFTPAEISRRLFISVFEAQEAIDRLTRLEMLEIGSGGKYKRCPEFMAQSQVPNDGLRRFHKQMLEKAIDSLESQTPKEKFVGSETFAVDSSRLGEASPLIEEFFTKIVKHFSNQKHKDHVYHLNLQFFKLTKEV